MNASCRPALRPTAIQRTPDSGWKQLGESHSPDNLSTSNRLQSGSCSDEVFGSWSLVSKFVFQCSSARRCRKGCHMKIHPVLKCFALAVLLLGMAAGFSTPSAAQVGIGISVRIGPPALPVYEQPICPGPGFLWSPGYWAWSDDDGYYWVPGTWVEAPQPGFLWTPGYWGWNDGVYVWNGGYWGPEVGFYGGINYGFGYFGAGFGGGEWRGGTFFYNTAVMRVDTVHITNVYVNKTVIVNSRSHVAFNGGEGGVAARPTARE